MSVSFDQAHDIAIALGVTKTDLIEALSTNGVDVELPPPIEPGKTFKAHRKGSDAQLNFITAENGWYVCWFGLVQDMPVMYSRDEFMREFEVKR